MSAKDNDFVQGAPSNEGRCPCCGQETPFGRRVTLAAARQIVRQQMNRAEARRQAVRDAEASLLTSIECPGCGRKHDVLDDGMQWTGVCTGCGWCAHPAITGDRCDQCGAMV